MKWSRLVIVVAVACAAACTPRQQQSPSPASAPTAASKPVLQPKEVDEQPQAITPPATSIPQPTSGEEQTSILLHVTPAWLKYAGDPGPRYAIDLVWDKTAKRVLLFGGGENTLLADQPRPDIAYFNDLWAWYPDKKAWQKIETGDVAPPPRAYYAAAYDSKRDGMWVHGGSRDYCLSDLWFFDCGTSTWRQIDDGAGERPQMRGGHSLHYNPVSDELYMFGGLLDWKTMQLSHEFWAFDCKTSKWMRKPLAPLARFMHLAALDEQNQKLYITGGFGTNAKFTEDKLWEYDIPSERWVSFDDAVGARILAGRMGHVPSRGCLEVVCGNDNDAEYRYDLSAHTWHRAKERLVLPPRAFHGMTIDPDGEKVFVYGGTFRGFFGACLAAEMWVRDLKINQARYQPVRQRQRQPDDGSPTQ